MSSDQVLHISNADFLQTVKDAGTPVLVDFYADWCGPCQMVAPILVELNKEYEGKVLITKMNVDENREVPSSYGVMSIPTVVVVNYENNEVVIKGKQIGFSGKEGLKQLIEEATV